MRHPDEAEYARTLATQPKSNGLRSFRKLLAPIDNHTEAKIVGGTIVDPKYTYPWFATFTNVGCGGTLVDKAKVLTAAHCALDGTSNTVRNNVLFFSLKFFPGLFFYFLKRTFCRTFSSTATIQCLPVLTQTWNSMKLSASLYHTSGTTLIMRTRHTNTISQLSPFLLRLQKTL